MVTQMTTRNQLDYATAVDFLSSVPLPPIHGMYDRKQCRAEFITNGLAKLQAEHCPLTGISGIATSNTHLGDLVRDLFGKTDDRWGRVTLLIDVTVYNQDELPGELESIYDCYERTGSHVDWKLETKVVEESHGRQILTIEIDGDYSDVQFPF